MVQGFSASGEYAGAATFLGEYAPSSKRGIYCSLIPASTAIGLLAGSMLATVMTSNLNADALSGWGWRIPFLLAGPLGLIVHYIRTQLADSPVYEQMTQALENKEKTTADGASPLKVLFRDHLRELIISFGASVLNAVGFYTVLTYLPTYLSETVGMDATQSSTITTICLILYVLLVFGMGHISDRFGRKKVLIGACVAFIVLTVPAFAILNTGQFWPVLLVELALCATLTANDGTLSSYLTETFPTNVRFTGFAFSFNLANALFGGTAPFIATWLIYTTKSTMSPAWYMVGIACMLMLCVARVLRPAFPAFRVGLAIACALWAGFCLERPARVVADYDAGCYLAGELREADVAYLADLGPESLPALRRLAADAPDADVREDATLQAGLVGSSTQWIPWWEQAILPPSL